MSVLFNAVYSIWTALTQSGLDGLTSGSIWTSEAIDNSTTLYQQFSVSAALKKASAGTATDWADIRILPVSGDGTTYATFDQGIVLPAMLLSGAGQEVFTSPWFNAPQKFKVAIKLNTASVALSATDADNSCWWQGRQEQGV